jgi:hypothetical protein
VCFSCSPSPSRNRVVVKPLLDRHIDLDDNNLSDWTDGFGIWSTSVDVQGQVKSKNQWDKVRGQSPTPLSSRDIDIKVYMAHDDNAWFIAADVLDDHLVPSIDPAKYPYGGDSLELFFAARHTTARIDYHNLASTLDEAGLLQMTIPAIPGASAANVISDYRTDPTLASRLLQPGSRLRVTTWSHSSTSWSMEMRIPFDVFSDDAKQAIAHETPLCLALDYLDYDQLPAKDHDVAPAYGFAPDNVFSMDLREANNKVPALMPTVVFARR